MRTYIDPDSTNIDECIEMLLRGMRAAHELHLSLRFPGFEPYTFGFDKGKKYTRIWNDNGTQRFVSFFIERETGDVWKADGWKGPAKNFPRGNIMSVEGRKAMTLGKLGENGYYYPGIA